MSLRFRILTSGLLVALLAAGTWIAWPTSESPPPTPPVEKLTSEATRGIEEDPSARFDYQLRRLVRRLNKEDEMENTLVVMSSDHGEMLGDHGQWGKNCAYEGATRVPLLLRFPEAWDRDPAGVIDRPVGLQDIMPTVLDAVDVEIPDTVEGRSLFDLLEDPDRGDWRGDRTGFDPLPCPGSRRRRRRAPSA